MIRSLWRKAKRFSTGKDPSWAYALLYLGSIPVFAGVYTVIAGDFQHTTVRYEPSMAGELEAIGEEVEKSLNKHVTSQYGDKAIVDHGWTVAQRPIRVDDIRYREGAFRCRLILALRRGGELIQSNTTEMSLGTAPAPMVNDHGEVKHHLKSVEFGRDSLTEFDPYVLLSNPPDWVLAAGERPRITFFPIRSELQERLEAYARGVEGFPASIAGSYWRMFYLSAVTITTLGFGDIVPITARARAWVAVEAIAGVLLAGLYLTSLSNSITPPSPPPPPSRP